MSQVLPTAGAARWRRAVPTALLAVGALAAGGLLCRVDPNAPGSLLPACPFHAFTGLYCPGCGATRALHALVHADIPTALAMNPLLVLGIPFVGLMALSAAGWNPPALGRFRQIFGNPKLWLVLLPGYWVARNLPWEPFSWLAPGV